MKKKILIAGGSGFLGQEIANFFANKGYDISVLTRGINQKKRNIKYIHWDAKTLGDWQQELASTNILINLTGKSVNCRYTDANKKKILSSRVDSTHILGRGIELSKTPPQLWFNASTATIYKHSTTRAMDEENGEIGHDFSMSVAQTWEAAFKESSTPHTRKIALRISLVLGPRGGVFPVMKKLVQFGLGGRQGAGNQKFAWIHQDDLLEIIQFCIENKNITGPINCVSTDTITNADFMRALRKSLNIPFGLPTPEIVLRLGAFLIGTEPELVLKSRFVYPKKLMDAGFEFRHKDINRALQQFL